MAAQAGEAKLVSIATRSPHSTLITSFSVVTNSTALVFSTSTAAVSMFQQQQPHYPTSTTAPPPTTVNRILSSAPFHSLSVLYTTKCAFSLCSQFAVLSDYNRIDIFCYDCFGSQPWTYATCQQCLYAIQQAVRSMGYSNQFTCGELAGDGLPPSCPLGALNLPSNAPFCEEQVVCCVQRKWALENYYMVLRPDGLITIYTHNLGNGSWSMRIPEDVFNCMTQNLKDRNIRNAMMDLETASVTTTYVQPKNTLGYSCVYPAYAAYNQAYNPFAPTQQTSTWALYTAPSPVYNPPNINQSAPAQAQRSSNKISPLSEWKRHLEQLREAKNFYEVADVVENSTLSSELHTLLLDKVREKMDELKIYRRMAEVADLLVEFAPALELNIPSWRLLKDKEYEKLLKEIWDEYAATKLQKEAKEKAAKQRAAEQRADELEEEERWAELLEKFDLLERASAEEGENAAKQREAKQVVDELEGEERWAELLEKFDSLERAAAEEGEDAAKQKKEAEQVADVLEGEERWAELFEKLALLEHAAVEEGEEAADEDSEDEEDDSDEASDDSEDSEDEEDSDEEDESEEDSTDEFDIVELN